MCRSNKQVGRVNYALRMLLVTAMAFTLEFLGVGLLHLDLLPRDVYALQWVIVFVVIGTFLLPVIDGRLLDIKFPSWLRFPVFAVWLLSVSIFGIRTREWPAGLGLFTLVLAIGCSIPGRTRVMLPPEVIDSDVMPKVPSVTEHAAKYPPRLLVSPLGFLRGLLTLVCLWLPLIWLADTSGWEAGVWIARFGYFILTLVWFFRLLGRLADAGRLPRARYGYLALVGILGIGIIRRVEHAHWSSLSGRAPSLETASSLYLWMKYVNGYEMLALFAVTQIPLALLASNSQSGLSVHGNNNAEQGSTKPTPVAKTNELALSGPFGFLRILLAIACLWVPLIYIDRTSSGNVGSWIARIGYLILGCSWLVFANGRLDDAGWGHCSYPSQYFLVVCVVSLMPMAFHWVNGYEALAIFALIQTPTVFLRSKPVIDVSVSDDSAISKSEGERRYS